MEVWEETEKGEGRGRTDSLRAVEFEKQGAPTRGLPGKNGERSGGRTGGRGPEITESKK